MPDIDDKNGIEHPGAPGLDEPGAPEAERKEPAQANVDRRSLNLGGTAEARPLRLEPGVDVTEFCEDWVRSEPLRELVSAFGGNPDELDRKTADAFVWLEAFSARWDFRRGSERNETVTPGFDSDMEALVNRTTRALGVQDTLPPTRSHYDCILVLGALARGCLARPLHAASLIESGLISTNDVTALCAFRDMNEAELARLGDFGFPGGTSEFDAIEFGMTRAFAPCRLTATEGQDSQDDTRQWRIHTYEHRDLNLRIAAAPSLSPGRRGNTAHTYQWLNGMEDHAVAGDSVLIVTTFHYRLYQLAAAILTMGLESDLALDAVGIVPGNLDERLEWQPSTGALLQELRSCARALRSVHGAVTAGSDPPD